MDSTFGTFISDIIFRTLSDTLVFSDGFSLPFMPITVFVYLIRTQKESGRGYVHDGGEKEKYWREKLIQYYSVFMNILDEMHDVIQI